MKRDSADDTDHEGGSESKEAGADGAVEEGVPGAPTDPSVAGLPGFDGGGGRSDPSVARLPEDGTADFGSPDAPDGSGADTDPGEGDGAVPVQRMRRDAEDWRRRQRRRRQVRARANSRTPVEVAEDRHTRPEDYDPGTWTGAAARGREHFEEMDEEAVRADAMAMIEKHEGIEEEFGERIAQYGQDSRSAGEYFYQSVEGVINGMLSGMITGGGTALVASGGNPVAALVGGLGTGAVGAVTGAASSPASTHFEHYVSEEYEKDYHEMGLADQAGLALDGIGSAVEGLQEAAGNTLEGIAGDFERAFSELPVVGSDGGPGEVPELESEAGSDVEETSTEDIEDGGWMASARSALGRVGSVVGDFGPDEAPELESGATEAEGEVSTEELAVDPEHLDRVERLREMDEAEDFTKLDPGEQERLIESLQKTGQMPSVLYGTMDRVDEGTLDLVEAKEKLEDGKNAATTTGLTTVGWEGLKDVVGTGVNPVEIGKKTGKKMGAKLLTTPITKAGMEVLEAKYGVKTWIKEAGDRHFGPEATGNAELEGAVHGPPDPTAALPDPDDGVPDPGRLLEDHTQDAAGYLPSPDDSVPDLGHLLEDHTQDAAGYLPSPDDDLRDGRATAEDTGPDSDSGSTDGRPNRSPPTDGRDGSGDGQSGGGSGSAKSEPDRRKERE